MESSNKSMDGNPNGTSMHAFINWVVEMEDIDLCMIEKSGIPQQEVTNFGNDQQGG